MQFQMQPENSDHDIFLIHHHKQAMFFQSELAIASLSKIAFLFGCWLTIIGKCLVVSCNAKHVVSFVLCFSRYHIV